MLPENLKFPKNAESEHHYVAGQTQFFRKRQSALSCPRKIRVCSSIVISCKMLQNDIKFARLRIKKDPTPQGVRSFCFMLQDAGQCPFRENWVCPATFFLFPLAPENCELNNFVWAFLLILSGVLRLSIKYGLSRFLLSLCCQ